MTSNIVKSDVTNHHIDNLIIYEYIVPNFYNELIDLNKNPYISDNFNEKIYKIISTLKVKYINEIIYNYCSTLAFNYLDKFITFIMAFPNENSLSSKFNYHTKTDYDENETIPFFITVNEVGLICQFPDKATIMNKLKKSKLRYVSYEMFFSDMLLQKKRPAHSVLLVFDKITQIMFIVDSNGTFNYFESIENCKIKQTLYSTMITYGAFIDFTYLTMSELNFSIRINIKIESNSQKNFFNGYCRAWTLFFQTILINAPDNFDFIEYLKEISKYDLSLLNELIEIFQIYVYNKFLIKYNFKVILDDSNSSNLSNLSNPSNSKSNNLDLNILKDLASYPNFDQSLFKSLTNEELIEQIQLLSINF